MSNLNYYVELNYKAVPVLLNILVMITTVPSLIGTRGFRERRTRDLRVDGTLR